MLTIIIGMVIFLVIARDMYFENGEFKFQYFLLGVGVGLVITIGITAMMSEMLPNQKVPGDQIQLYTMNRGDPTIQGRLFLGSGIIDQEPSYEWNYYDKDGSLVDDHVGIYNYHYDIHKFLDQPEGNAYLVIYKDEYRYPWFKYIALFPSDQGPTRYDFHLPENAIVPEINVQP